MVTLQGGNLRPMSFGDMIDPSTNRTCIRRVDVNSDSYRVARAYMIRLERGDLTDPDMLAKLARAANLDASQFEDRYGVAATRLCETADD